MKRTLGEIFDHHATLSKQADKIAWLHQHNSTSLRWFLGLAHSGVEWTLPEGAPPFKQDATPIGYSPSNLMRELRTIYLFLKDGGGNIMTSRREQLFQQLLERLHKSETDLILAVKDNKFGTKYKCTKAIVEAAFPGLLDNPFPLHFLR